MREPTPEQQEAWDLAQIHQRRTRLVAKPIGGVIRRLMASSGYSETQATAQLQQHWEQAVGEILAKLSRPGNISRGALQVEVANSATMQEIHFRKKQILESLRSSTANSGIASLRIRVGKFD